MARMACFMLDWAKYPPADLKGKIMNLSATMQLRWFSEAVHKPPRLQQAWQNTETGELVWRDVQFVYAG